MKLGLAFFLLPLALAQAQTQTQVPTDVTPIGTPGLSYLYTLNATLDQAIYYGAGPLRNRTAYPITGGWFTGPKLNGTVGNLGADWGLTDSNGKWFPDTRYHLQTHDGAGIFIQTEGPEQADGLIHLRIIFETGHPDYYWLNYIVAMGILYGPDDADWVMIDAWQLTSPSLSS